MLDGESMGSGAEAEVGPKDEEAHVGPQQRRGSRSLKDQNLQLKAKRESAMRVKGLENTRAFSTG